MAKSSLSSKISSYCKQYWRAKLQQSTPRLSEQLELLIEEVYTDLSPFDKVNLESEFQALGLSDLIPKKEKLTILNDLVLEKILTEVSARINSKGIESFIDNSKEVGLRTKALKLKQLLSKIEQEDWQQPFHKPKLWAGTGVIIKVGDWNFVEEAGIMTISAPQKEAKIISNTYYEIKDLASSSYDYRSKYEFFGRPAEAIGQHISTVEHPNIAIIVKTIISSAIQFVDTKIELTINSVHSDRILIESLMKTDDLSLFD